MTPAAIAVVEAERRLLVRCQELGHRLDDGGDVWTQYIEAITAVVALIPPERRSLLTTAEMAERLNVSPRTVRKLGKAGRLEAIRLGARGSAAIRWRSA